MSPDPYLPETTGFDALAELDRVDWSTLRHAYGIGVVGDSVSGDVARSIALLREDPDMAFGDGLWSNVCHQGTVYQASAYALPFIGAVAAGDVSSELRTWLTTLFGDIAVGGSYVARGGSYAGSFGDGVDMLIRETVTRCDKYLAAIEEADQSLVPLIAAVRRVNAEPSDENRQGALDLIDPE